jgi:hypothetical protein
MIALSLNVLSSNLKPWPQHVDAFFEVCLFQECSATERPLAAGSLSKWRAAAPGQAKSGSTRLDEASDLACRASRVETRGPSRDDRSEDLVSFFSLFLPVQPASCRADASNAIRAPRPRGAGGVRHPGRRRAAARVTGPRAELSCAAARPARRGRPAGGAGRAVVPTDQATRARLLAVERRAPAMILRLLAAIIWRMVERGFRDPLNDYRAGVVCNCNCKCHVFLAGNSRHRWRRRRRRRRCTHDRRTSRRLSSEEIRKEGA